MNHPQQIKSYPDLLFRKNINISVTPATDPVELLETARTHARLLCKSAFDNLDDYPYVYFTSGITEAITFLLVRRPIFARPREYRYVFSHSNVTTTPSNVEYRSYPFSATGKFEEIPTDREVILDCAYMFASNMSNPKTLPPNVSNVLFGLSKSHNLADVRVGWVFSKTKFIGPHTLQYDYGYGSSVIANAVATALQYRPNELYLTHKDSLSELYSANNVIENDTNLFGVNSANERVPYYTLGEI